MAKTAPTNVNAEAYITARMTMAQLFDYERCKAIVKERYPNWDTGDGVWWAWTKVGDPVMENTLLPQQWFELGMMYVLHREGKLPEGN
jgi:hypothetical protein